MRQKIMATLVAALLISPVAANGESPTTTLLHNIPPSWSLKLQCDARACPRFEVVLGGAAVLDHETGLVWERSPSSNRVDYYTALYDCARRDVGGRSGWHLPTVEQLMSLVDKSVDGSPKLPVGNPFILVQNPQYWSGTTYENNQNLATAWGVYFADGGAIPTVKSLPEFAAWCVRGGQSNDGQ